MPDPSVARSAAQMTSALDVWRVCGQPVAAGPGSGCTCTPNDPTRWAAQRALARLNTQEGGPVPAAPRERGSTRKAGG